MFETLVLIIRQRCLKIKVSSTKKFCASIIILNISIEKFDTSIAKAAKNFVKLNT